MHRIFLFFAILSTHLFGQTVSYFYNGNEQLLHPKQNQFHIQFSQNTTGAQIEAILTETFGSQMKQADRFYGAQSRIIHLYNTLTNSEIETFLNQLSAHKSILSANSVYIKNGIRSTISNEFIVQFSDALTAQEIQQIFNKYQVTSVREMGFNTWLLAASKTQYTNGLTAANHFHTLNDVEWATPNFIYFNNEILNSVNDPHYAQQWAHVNSGQEVVNNAPDGYPSHVKGFSNADMDVDLAWLEVEKQGKKPGEGVLIGVIDSGIELDHPDLKNNIYASGKDFTPDQQTDGNDVTGHGTNVAGIIAAESDNGIGVAGIAPFAKLLPVRINGAWGSASDAQIAEAIDFAWQEGCDILSNSWSGTNASEAVSSAIKRAKKDGRNGLGCVIVFSTGNAGHGWLEFPSAMEEVIGVGAANMFDEKKNQGSRDFNRKWGGNWGPELDLLGPTLVYTTDLTGKNGFVDGDYNPAFSGTSAACPHVSGVAALVLGVDPGLSSDAVQDILQNGADKVDRYKFNRDGWNAHVGYGRVNALNAVNGAIGGDGDLPYFSFEKPNTTKSIEAIQLNVEIYDKAGINKAELVLRTYYRGTVSDWKTIQGEAKGVNQFTFMLPGQKWETQVEYYLRAYDASNENRVVTFPTKGDKESAPPLFFYYHVGETDLVTYSAQDVPISWERAFEYSTSTLNIKDDFLIVDADAEVNISGQIQDFAVILESPKPAGNGLLSLHPGEAYTNTVLDDEASSEIADGSTPYSGSFKPDNGLFVYDGLSSNGDWKLKVYDDFQYNNGGRISDWNLKLTKLRENPAPSVKGIPSQTIEEGATFTIIQLDNYVTDANHNASEMSWSSSGNSALNVVFDTNKRTATVQTPSADWHGSETITFVATDPGGASGSEAVPFTVNNINDAPVVSTIPGQEINEGETFTTIRLDNYVTDPDNDDAEISWSYTNNGALSVSISSERIATITAPNMDWHGSETINFIARDPGQLSDESRATFKVNPVNDPPIISPIPSQTIDEGNTFETINLNNYVSDADHSDDALIWSFSGNSDLTVSIEKNIATISTPHNDWYGSEEITFTVTDPLQASDSAPVKFIVNNINDAPLVEDIRNQTIDEGQTFTTLYLDELVSDIDNSDAEMSWSVNGNKELIVEINASREATITAPHKDWFGSETLTFIAKDPAGLSDATTATYRITAINDAPQMSTIPSQTIDEGKSFNAIPLDNYVHDVDNDDSELVWSYSGNKSLSVTINANRVATITAPNSDWHGAEEITFTVADPSDLKDTQTVPFTINSVNDAPIVELIPNQTIQEGQKFSSISLDNYVSDADHSKTDLSWSYSGNNELSVSIVNRVATISIPNVNWSGQETITFTATDPENGSDSDAAIFSVGAQNDAPIVSRIPDQTIDEGNTFATITLNNYVSDADNSPSEMKWTFSGNSDLSVKINSSNIATITIPNSNWNGSEQITFTATDPGGLSDSDAAQFTVNAVNDAPVVNAIPSQTITEGNQFRTLRLDSYVSDVDNADAELSWTYNGNTDLSVQISPDRIATISTPSNTWNGSETITFSAKDPSGLSDSGTAKFTVSASNNAPVISTIPNQTINEGETFAAIPLDNYVSDVDDADNTLVWSFTGNSALNVVIDANRIAQINPKDSEWNGSESITFTVTDPGQLSDTQEVKFTVNGSNDAPKFVSALPNLSVDEDKTLNYPKSNWYPFVEDVDNADEELSYKISGNNPFISATENGASWLFSAQKDWFGIDTLTLTVSDGTASAQSTFILTFNAVNDAPVITSFPDSIHFESGETHVLELTALESDVDNKSSQLTWIFESDTNAITVEYDHSEKFLILTSENWHGVTRLKARLEDSGMLSDNASAIVNVAKKVTSIVNNKIVPKRFSLEQNYPNPFNPSTTIRYFLSEGGAVELTVYNLLGKKITTLVNHYQAAGGHKILFSNKDIASGIYIYILKTKDYVAKRKMVLLK